MLSTHNILSPANGRPHRDADPGHRAGLLLPDQGEAGRPRARAGSSPAPMEVRGIAFEARRRRPARRDQGALQRQAARDHRRAACSSTRSCPPELGFVNKVLDKKELEDLVGDCYRTLGTGRAPSSFLDELKDLGFQYATRAGITVGIDDMRDPRRRRRRSSTTRQQGSGRDRRSSTSRASSPTASATTRSSTSGPTSPTRSAKVMFEGLAADQRRASTRSS